MQVEKFRDQVAQMALYKQQKPSDLASDILSEWETNKRLSSAMAIEISAYSKLSSCYKGEYAVELGHNLDGIDTLFGGVSGWRINMAIQAKNAETAKEPVQPKQGIMEKLTNGTS